MRERFSIEEFKRRIASKHPVTVRDRATCYCGASAYATYYELRNAGWRWLVSWYGWACPRCTPRPEVRA